MSGLTTNVWLWLAINLENQECATEIEIGVNEPNTSFGLLHGVIESQVWQPRTLSYPFQSRLGEVLGIEISPKLVV